jgi:hypothetical protein
VQYADRTHLCPRRFLDDEREYADRHRTSGDAGDECFGMRDPEATIESGSTSGDVEGGLKDHERRVEAA